MSQSQRDAFSDQLFGDEYFKATGRTLGIQLKRSFSVFLKRNKCKLIKEKEKLNIPTRSQYSIAA